MKSNQSRVKNPNLSDKSHLSSSLIFGKYRTRRPPDREFQRFGIGSGAGTRKLRRFLCRHKKEWARLAAPCPLIILPIVVISQRTVVSTGPHAALLETYVRSRTDGDHFCRGSLRVPSRRGPRGTALDLSFGREPLPSLAASLMKKSCCSWQSLLSDGFARHITESELLH